MPEPLLFALALLCSLAGMAGLALSMEAHREQFSLRAARMGWQRLLSCALLLISLAVDLRADHPSMAVLVWLMSLSFSALLAALAMTWLSSTMRGASGAGRQS